MDRSHTCNSAFGLAVGQGGCYFFRVCVTPKGAYEPWMLFRKPIEERTVAANLRRWKTGNLRSLSAEQPLRDIIPSVRSLDREEAISSHPCLKPQHFMRIIVRALLPLGEGMVLDPFMGSGSTIAAAEAVGYDSTGVELDADYFRLAERVILRLASRFPDFKGSSFELVIGSNSVLRADANQPDFVQAEESAWCAGVKVRRRPGAP